MTVADFASFVHGDHFAENTEISQIFFFFCFQGESQQTIVCGSWKKKNGNFTERFLEEDGDRDFL